jgi:hypothetical protein
MVWLLDLSAYPSKLIGDIASGGRCYLTAFLENIPNSLIVVIQFLQDEGDVVSLLRCSYI